MRKSWFTEEQIFAILLEQEVGVSMADVCCRNGISNATFFKVEGQIWKRQGTVVNLKKIRRLCAEERLQVRQRKGRKKATGTRSPIAAPQEPNQRWGLDFVSDVFAHGRRFRVFAVVDDFTAESLCLEADKSLSGLRVAWELDTVIPPGRHLPCLSPTTFYEWRDGGREDMISRPANLRLQHKH